MKLLLCRGRAHARQDWDGSNRPLVRRPFVRRPFVRRPFVRRRFVRGILQRPRREVPAASHSPATSFRVTKKNQPRQPTPLWQKNDDSQQDQDDDDSQKLLDELLLPVTEDIATMMTVVRDGKEWQRIGHELLSVGSPPAGTCATITVVGHVIRNSSGFELAVVATVCSSCHKLVEVDAEEEDEDGLLLAIPDRSFTYSDADILEGLPETVRAWEGSRSIGRLRCATPSSMMKPGDVIPTKQRKLEVRHS